jgi:hypothetical protein
LLVRTLISKLGCIMDSLMLNGAISYAKLYVMLDIEEDRTENKHRSSFLKPIERHNTSLVLVFLNERLSKDEYSSVLIRSEHTYAGQNHDMSILLLTHMRQYRLDSVYWCVKVGLELALAESKSFKRLTELFYSSY